jgi:hypothetical protein
VYSSLLDLWLKSQKTTENRQKEVVFWTIFGKKGIIIKKTRHRGTKIKD